VWIEPEDEARLVRLRSLSAAEGILSVYLPIEAGQALHHGYVPALMDILRDAREAAASDAERERIEAESERVLRYVREEYTPAGRTLVLFASGPRDLLEPLRIQLALPALARFRAKPFLAPLDAAMEDEPRVAVAVVDERQARIFVTFLGELESRQKMADAVPGLQRQGGWSAFKYERDRLHHIEEHFRHVAGVLVEQHRRLPFKRLVLGGTDENVEAMRDALPEDLRRAVAGTFPAEMFATDSDLVQAAIPIAEAAERAEEVALATEVRDRAMAGGPAALGWEETLQTLAEGRVHGLALAARHLGTKEGEKALALAWDTDARVEFLRGEAEAILDANGGIGALLRY